MEQDGLTLMEALKHYSNADLWREYEDLQKYRLTVFWIGGPEHPDEQKHWRLLHIEEQLQHELQNKLIRGELIATAYVVPLRTDSKPVQIGADKWKLLTVNFEESTATGHGLDVVDIRVTSGQQISPFPDEDNESAKTAPHAPNIPAFLFRKESDHWLVRYEERAFVFRDHVGFRYIQALLGAPGETFPVANLIRLVDYSVASSKPAGDLATSDLSFNAIEPEEHKRLKERLKTIQDEIEDAMEFADLGRVEDLENEREAIAKDLTKRINIYGRSRRIGDVTEKIRSRVKQAITRALGYVLKEDPELHAHLVASIRTGSVCSYNPAKPITWTTT